MELLYTAYKSIVEKIKKQNNRQKAKIDTLFNKIYLRPYCLIAWIDNTAPTIPKRHPNIGIDFS